MNKLCLLNTTHILFRTKVFITVFFMISRCLKVGNLERKIMLTAIHCCGHLNNSSGKVRKSSTVSFVFLICLTSQRSGRPPDLCHSRRSAEHIPMIRKEKPSTARHRATAGLCNSLTHAVTQSFNYISQHALRFSTDKTLSLMGKKMHMA